MSIDLRYNGQGYYDLKEHIGHRVVVVGYRQNESEPPQNVAIECDTCGVVLVDFELPFYDEEGKCGECGSDTYVDDHPEEGDGEVYCTNECCDNAKEDWGSIGEPS